ncbi:hypothetical protein [Jeongeupia chitinilytica]|uniref:hypothetical protein n=1 Tax=Jeongeupia chitinilytica TaxID=1041641 RepID=UPI0016792FF2|nr:hypothetical protein [Jeongeupia chitinilytica]
MNLDVIVKILAPILTAIIGFVIKKYLEERPKLITYLVHASAIPLIHENTTHIINTHSIVVRNAGKKTAHNVRIGHNHLPASYQLYPQLDHELKNGSNGTAEILIPTLVPDEQINISYLYAPPITHSQINAYCKSDEASARYINIVPSPPVPKIQAFALWSLIFLGASTALYWIFITLWSLAH